MPQFDKITFFNQVFWLLFFFSGFYLLLLYYFLPKLSSVLKARQKMLKNSLDGVSLMFNERSQTLIAIQNNCSDLLAHKNYGVFLSTTLYFIEWLKSNLPKTFNTSLKSGLKKTEDRIYRQTSVLYFVRDLKVSDIK